MMVDKHFILAVPTVILALFSLISSFYVCLSIMDTGYQPCTCPKKRNDRIHNAYGTPSIASQKSNSSNQGKTVMNVIIFWMSIVDGCHMLPIIVNWTPQFISNSWFFDKTGCTAIGVVAQFCCIQSPLWHILLAYHLAFLLCGGKLQTIQNQTKYHFVCVNIIPLIATIIPAIFHQYQMTNLNGDKDCWVIDESQWMFIAFITISLVFHYTVLIIAIYKFKVYKTFAAFSFQYYQIVIKLLRFVVVYTVIRIFPLIERIYQIHYGDDVPFYMVLIQHYSIAVIGIANAVVWYWNQRNDEQFYSVYQQKLNKYKFHQNGENHNNLNDGTPINDENGGGSTMNSTSYNQRATITNNKSTNHQNRTDDTFSTSGITTTTAIQTTPIVNINNVRHQSETGFAGDL